MFRKETLQQIAVPAFCMLAATVVCAFLFGYAGSIGVVFLLIQQLFALLTGYFAVIRLGRSRIHLWVNYLIWFLLPNIGSIAQYFGWQP